MWRILFISILALMMLGCQDYGGSVVPTPGPGVRLYVAGNTTSTSYPVTDGSTHGGPTSANPNAVLSVLQPGTSSTSLLASTYLGHPTTNIGNMQARTVWVDPSSGDIYVGGRTGSANGGLATTAGTFQPNYNGPSPANAFICRFTAAGVKVWCSYVGIDVTSASGTENAAYAIAGIDNQGYLTFCGKMDPAPDGQTLTNQSNSAYSIRLHWIGPFAQAASETAYCAKATVDGSQLIWFTEFGGSNGGANRGRAVIDNNGNIYGQGDFVGADFPCTRVGAFCGPNGTVPAVYNTFGPYNCNTANNASGILYEVKSDGSQLVWAAYVTGSGAAGFGDGAEGGLRLDSAANPQHLYFAGTSLSLNTFHTADQNCTQANASGFQKTLPSGQTGMGSGYVMDVNPTNGSLLHGTFLGGSQGGWHAANYPNYVEDTEANGIVLDASGNVIVNGWTAYTDFVGLPSSYPSGYKTSKPGTYQFSTSAFLVKLSPDLSTLLAVTYYGGSMEEFTGFSGGVQVDPATQNIYAYINTASSDFQPITSNAFQSTYQGTGGFDITVVGFNPSLTTAVYGSFLGGPGAFSSLPDCNASQPPINQNCGNWGWDMALSTTSGSAP